jgi:hypothetical protein
MQPVKVVRKLTDAERAWIRLTQNPYASLSLREPDDEQAMVIPSNNNPKHSSCSLLSSKAALPSRSHII